MVNLEQCRKAELYSGNELVCEASVTAGPMGSILLDVPRSVAYGKDKPYLVKFYDPSLGVLTCRCVLSGPMDLPEDMRSLRCDIVEQLEQLQRREGAHQRAGDAPRGAQAGGSVYSPEGVAGHGAQHQRGGRLREHGPEPERGA